MSTRASLPLCYDYNLHPTGHCQKSDVTQQPGTIWSLAQKTAEMNCSHEKDVGHNQMYWFRQRPGESMMLIVFTSVGLQPDYGDLSKTKYSAVKSVAQNGAFTVKDLTPEDSGLYFCAVSQHSDTN